jgi:hypothetical protein
MAMYLQQKDVEATVLAWIQAGCIFIIDEVYEKTADSFEDRKKVLAVLKGQENELKAVCLPPFIPCSTLSALLQVLPGPLEWNETFWTALSLALHEIRKDPLLQYLQHSSLHLMFRASGACSALSVPHVTLPPNFVEYGDKTISRQFSGICDAGSSRTANRCSEVDSGQSCVPLAA